jgi:3,4-dihydroxy 2-butanone 4-phosphate synthase/GTP cyclohydrolase II
VLIYLSYPQRSTSLNNLDATHPPSQKDDENMKNMDARLLGIGAQIIRSLGIQRMRTHVSQQRTFKGLAGFGLEVVDHVVIGSK